MAGLENKCKQTYGWNGFSWSLRWHLSPGKEPWKTEFVNGTRTYQIKGLKPGISYRVRVVAKDHSDATVHSTEEMLITVPGEESMSVQRWSPPVNHPSSPASGLPDTTCSFSSEWACSTSKRVHGNIDACHFSFFSAFFFSFQIILFILQ